MREAVQSVLSQQIDGAGAEVVVVNDSGEPLADADWQRDPRVRVADTYRTERSVARNTGAALSRGDYLHFLDDDDVALPGAYAAFLNAIQRAPDAVLAVGKYEAVFDEGRNVQIVQPVADNRLFALLVAGVGIPLGACLIRRNAFFQAGCFDATFTVMEDLELLQRLVLLGRTEVVDWTIARFRMGGHQLSTTKWESGSQACRMQREKAFGTPGCFSKLRESLRCEDTALTRGCIVRFYAGSAYRHAKSWRLCSAAERLGAALWLAVPGIPHRHFWRGMCGMLPKLGLSSTAGRDESQKVVV